MTNKEIYLSYEEYIATSGYTKSTISAYLNHARHLYSYAQFKGLRIDFMTYKDMIAYKKHLLLIYKPLTINNKLSAIRGLFDFLIQIEVVKTNIVFNALFITIDKVRPQTLSLTNQALLLDFLSTKGDNIKLAFNIMLSAGLRLSEVTAIKKKDIEVIGEKVYIHVFDFKTNKLRLAPVFDDQVADDIIAKLNDTLSIGEYLNYISPRALQYHASNFAQIHKIKFSAHTCRHIYATNRFKDNIRIELIKELMGHKSIQTTLMYIYIHQDEIYKLI